MRVLVRVAIALVVIGVLSVAGAYAYLQNAIKTPVDPRGAEREIDFRVPTGATKNQIGALLQKEGMIESATIWKLFVRLHRPEAPKAGRHRIHPGMNMPELAAQLAATPLSDDVPLTMVEGWRMRDADAWLAAQKLIPPGAYVNAASTPNRFKIPFPFDAPTLEGYLFPETYMVPPGPIDVDKLIQRQIDAFAERYWKPSKAEIESSGRSLHDLVIVASMLEREEPTPAVRDQVAGVIYKRLERRIPLGIDATSRYNLVDWNERKPFLAALRDPNEPYNTRLRAGLPPGPIGAPSVESLIAALRPQKTPYLYYLHDAERKIHFAITAEEHEANRKRYNVY